MVLQLSTPGVSQEENSLDTHTHFQSVRGPGKCTTEFSLHLQEIYLTQTKKNESCSVIGADWRTYRAWLASPNIRLGVILNKVLILHRYNKLLNTLLNIY